MGTPSLMMLCMKTSQEESYVESFLAELTEPQLSVETQQLLLIVLYYKKNVSEC